MIPLTKNQHSWGFVCGRVSVLEGRLVSSDFFTGVVAVERSEDLLHRLQETQMRDYIAPGSSWEDWSTVIDVFFHDQAVSLRGGSPDPTLANMFLLSEDYLNIKRALLGLGTYPFCTGTFSTEQLNAIAAGNHGLLPAELRAPVAELGGQITSDGNSRMLLDLALDGAYLRQILAMGKSLGVPLLDAWLQEMTLARAAVALWRAVRGGVPMRLYQQHFLPVGEFNHVLNELAGAGDPQTWGALLPGQVGTLWQEAVQLPEDEQIMRFGVLMYDYLTSVARRAKLQTAGPERVFGYLWGLLVEIYNLKLVINGRLNGIDADILRPRLRECYV